VGDKGTVHPFAPAKRFLAPSAAATRLKAKTRHLALVERFQGLVHRGFTIRVPAAQFMSVDRGAITRRLAGTMPGLSTTEQRNVSPISRL
jgi:hypothetical protein